MEKRWLLVLWCLVGLSLPLYADQACEDQCHQDYYNCPCFDYWSCAACDNQINQCLSYCSSCPSTRDYTTSTITGRQATGRNGCYEDHIYFYSGKRYVEFLTTERRDTYRETTNCDGTKTTVLIGTGTISYDCWARDPIASCSNYAPNFLLICR